MVFKTKKFHELFPCDKIIVANGTHKNLTGLPVIHECEKTLTGRVVSLLLLICLCLNILSVSSHPPKAEAAPPRIVVLSVSPVYPDGVWERIASNNRIANGKTLFGDTLYLVVRSISTPGQPTVELLGSMVRHPQLTIIDRQTMGNMTTITYRITGILKRVGLRRFPTTNINAGLKVWEWHGSVKIEHLVTLEWQAYADWR